MGTVIKVIENGRVFDTENVSITYVKQASDLGDITKVNSSYSWKFKLPKTQNNTFILQGLGMVGDQSRVPYVKYHCQIVDNGIEIVSYGLLKVQNTGKEYQAFIQEGIIEFYDAIKTDTISDAVPDFLESIRHQSTIQNIVNSQLPGSPYRYLVADYNYIPADTTNIPTRITQVGMIPSISMDRLFLEILTIYGWTYEGLPDISDLWLTYPITKDTVDGVVLQIFDNVYSQQTIVKLPDIYIYNIPNGTFLNDALWIEEFAPPFLDKKWTMLQSGNFRISTNISGYIPVYDGNTGGNEWQDEPIYLAVYRNGNQIAGAISTQGVSTVEVILNEGDVIEIFCEAQYDYADDIEINSAGVRIEAINVADIDFLNALVKYKVKDYFKEIMLRTAVTAYADAQTKHITFKTLDERLQSEPIDWSSKFVKRLKESYVYNTYAQENYFRHQYNNGFEQDYADGLLLVDNQNLPVSKTLYTSKIYAPTEETQEWFSSGGTNNGSQFFVKTYPMWVAEPKEEDDPNNAGEKITVIEYKPLKGRFYVIQQGTLRTGGISIDGFIMNNFYPASTDGSNYIEVIGEKYELIRRILDDSRIHTIELLLSKADMMALDLSANYYFEWEKNVYILNKVTWKQGKISTGEFIRINYFK